MAQFTVYSSADAGGPGQLTGEVNTLNLLLRACLVTGYVGHAAAGWTEPIATAGNIAAFKQGAGSGFHVLVNDNGPNATSTFKEAWVTGWETLAGIGSPVGTGAGQFPLPAQLLATGHAVWRKSASADAVGREWILFADARTFYLFVFAADAAGVALTGIFGDVFSVKSTADAYNCWISGRTTENSSANVSGFQGNMSATPTSAIAGNFLARTYTGAGGSITMGHQGDPGKSSGAFYTGLIQYPNGPDNSMYISPIWIFEISAGIIRGRARGLYHVCHALASFSLGQQFVGAGDYAGKTFQIVTSLGSTTSGFVAVEVSNTLETN